MARFHAILLALCMLIGASSLQAHEARPALLDIRQTAPTSYVIVWKRPMLGDVGIHLRPRLSNGWLDQQPRERYAAGSFMIERWQIDDADPLALKQARLEVDGLQGTITDVFVRATFQDGRRIEGVLRGEEPEFRFGIAQADGSDPLRFLKLGMHHILSGPDHLLFVLGLLLLSGGGWKLVTTISGFTLAHSITLTIATVWRLDLPLSLIDMLVALSILSLAPELIRAQRGGTSLTLRRPMIPAFIFGLLHGLGFASGLTSLDFDRASLFGALLQFNLGVEIGQLVFVGGVLAIIYLFRRAAQMTRFRLPRAAAQMPAYFIGIAGATWLFQCAAAVAAGR